MGPLIKVMSFYFWALFTVDDVFLVSVDSVFGELPYDFFVVVEGDVGGGGSVALLIFDDIDVVVVGGEVADATGRRSEVDADGEVLDGH